MDDLTPAELEELRQALVALQGEIEGQLSATRDTTRPVDLDEPIGRLTRMDAIQQQSVSAANRRSLDLRLRQVQQALRFVARGDYGLCRRCEDSIGHSRLSARPESPYCLECQDAIDLKNS